MEEQLRLIRTSRAELKELARLKDIAKKSCDDNEREFDNIFSEMNNIEVILSKLEMEFSNKKEIKLLKITSPIGILCSIISFLYLMNLNYSSLIEYFISFFLVFVSGGIGAFGSAFLSIMAFSSKIEKFLIKKDNNLKILYDKVVELRNNVSNKEKILMSLRDNRDPLLKAYINSNEKFERKKDELLALEESFFEVLDNFINLENEEILNKSYCGSSNVQGKCLIKKFTDTSIKMEIRL